MADPVILFFVLGVLARALRSDLRLPGALYETLAIYLLLAIGLKGGVELARNPFWVLAPQIVLILILGFTLPLIAFPILRSIGRLSRETSGAIAAHYGSVSVVTFAVAMTYATERSIVFESHLVLFVALLEAPGIVTGILLGRGITRAGSIGWTRLLREVLAGKSVVLLIGGLLIGWIIGPSGVTQIEGVFFDLFKGVLCLFLLEMGLVVGGRLGDVRRSGLFLAGFAVVVPVLFACIGALLGRGMGLSPGGAGLLATLAASASYIAAPAATRMALPQANPVLSLTAALAITFPFNITLGIPLYLAIASQLYS